MLKPTVRLVEEPGALAAAGDEIAGATPLGIDTEFVRERTYYPHPGLLQVSDGEVVWLLDPIALADRAELGALVADLMGAESVIKILHSTGEDLEVLDLLAGTAAPPQPLFDTQRAAALLGWPLQVRYEVLARDLLGVEFPGGLGRNNWLRRPLPAAWMDYAAHDVIALPAMRERLAGRLDDAGRTEWLAEDCARLARRADDDPLLRVRGAPGLDDEALERLNRLVRWREDRARDRNLPRGFVIRDEVLLALAQGGPAGFNQALAGARRVPDRDREALRDIVERDPDTSFTRPAELVPLERSQRERLKILQAQVREAAKALGVEPPLLASKRDLTRLLQGSPCAWLDGWRAGVLDLRAS